MQLVTRWSAAPGRQSSRNCTNKTIVALFLFSESLSFFSKWKRKKSSLFYTLAFFCVRTPFFSSFCCRRRWGDGWSVERLCASNNVNIFGEGEKTDEKKEEDEGFVCPRAEFLLLREVFFSYCFFCFQICFLFCCFFPNLFASFFCYWFTFCVLVALRKFMESLPHGIFMPAFFFIWKEVSSFLYTPHFSFSLAWLRFCLNFIVRFKLLVRLYCVLELFQDLLLIWLYEAPARSIQKFRD